MNRTGSILTADVLSERHSFSSWETVEFTGTFEQWDDESSLNEESSDSLTFLILFVFNQ